MGTVKLTDDELAVVIAAAAEDKLDKFEENGLSGEDCLKIMNQDMMNLLHIAIYTNSLRVIDYITNNIDVSDEIVKLSSLNETYLHYSARSGTNYVMEKLLTSDLLVDIKDVLIKLIWQADNRGYTSWHYAMLEANIDYVISVLDMHKDHSATLYTELMKISAKVGSSLVPLALTGSREDTTLVLTKLLEILGINKVIKILCAKDLIYPPSIFLYVMRDISHVIVDILRGMDANMLMNVKDNNGYTILDAVSEQNHWLHDELKDKVDMCQANDEQGDTRSTSDIESGAEDVEGLYRQCYSQRLAMEPEGDTLTINEDIIAEGVRLYRGGSYEKCVDLLLEHLKTIRRVKGTIDVRSVLYMKLTRATVALVKQKMNNKQDTKEIAGLLAKSRCYIRIYIAMNNKDSDGYSMLAQIYSLSGDYAEASQQAYNAYTLLLEQNIPMEEHTATLKSYIMKARAAHQGETCDRYDVPTYGMREHYVDMDNR